MSDSSHSDIYAKSQPTNRGERNDEHLKPVGRQQSGSQAKTQRLQSENSVGRVGPSISCLSRSDSVIGGYSPSSDPIGLVPDSDQAQDRAPSQGFRCPYRVRRNATEPEATSRCHGVPRLIALARNALRRASSDDQEKRRWPKRDRERADRGCNETRKSRCST